MDPKEHGNLFLRDPPPDIPFDLIGGILRLLIRILQLLDMETCPVIPHRFQIFPVALFVIADHLQGIPDNISR